MLGQWFGDSLFPDKTVYRFTDRRHLFGRRVTLEGLVCGFIRQLLFCCSVLKKPSIFNYSTQDAYLLDYLLQGTLLSVIYIDVKVFNVNLQKEME